ncbi:glycosyltransferase family 4 protein [Patulibacter defluvii]|uniref:glycosyltransferase family 4 protein n=1 Tax=Patulibacter defluvii TaxID=3095358 RepID=UPI002A75EFDC|nr:glycosyltransferase family 4 protein [Patulibacter sp. DM4]
MAEATIATRELHVHALIDYLGFGGAEAVLAELAAVAPSVGIRLTVGCLSREHIDGGAGRRIVDAGIAPEYLGTSTLIGRADRARVQAHLERVRPDVLHTHLDYADVLGGLAARRLGLPAVSTWHSAAILPGLRTRAVGALSARVRRRASRRIVTVSEAARRTYLERWPVDPARVVAVHNAVGRAPEPGAGAVIRRELGIPPTAPVLGVLSMLRPEKGHDVTAAALAAIRARHPELRVIVAGDGVQRPALERAAAQLGDGVVHLLGTRQDVMRVLDAVDLLVQPSRAEALGMSIIEGFAAGVPAVATAVGGIPEVVDETVGATIPAPPQAADLAAAVNRLLDDREGLRRLGRAARARYEQRFSVSRWGHALRVVYDQALAADGAPTGNGAR